MSRFESETNNNITITVTTSNGNELNSQMETMKLEKKWKINREHSRKKCLEKVYKINYT